MAPIPKRTIKIKIRVKTLREKTSQRIVTQRIRLPAINQRTSRNLGVPGRRLRPLGRRRPQSLPTLQPTSLRKIRDRRPKNRSQTRIVLVFVGGGRILAHDATCTRNSKRCQFQHLLRHLPTQQSREAPRQIPHPHPSLRSRFFRQYPTKAARIRVPTFMTSSRLRKLSIVKRCWISPRPSSVVRQPRPGSQEGRPRKLKR